MNLHLSDKAVLITGASGGIGRACAVAFAAEGAKLALSDIDENGLESLMRELAPSTEVVPIIANVTLPEDALRAVEQTTGRYGGVDVLVNCAGVLDGTSFDLVSVDEWRSVQDVNLTGTFLMCQAALRAMVAQGSGRIVNVASVSGQTGGKVVGASYVASKAGVIALTKHLARHGSGHGIGVNCVSPGYVDTPMTSDWGAEVDQEVTRAIPIGRAARADEIASVVTFLGSVAASYMQGANVNVNGGVYM